MLSMLKLLIRCLEVNAKKEKNWMRKLITLNGLYGLLKGRWRLICHI